MDISKQWQTLSKEKFINQHTEKDKIMAALQKDSQSTISQLKSRLLIKLRWIVFFISAFILIILFNLDKSGVIAVMGVGIFLYGLAFVAIYQDYQKMGSDEEFLKTSLVSMKSNLAYIKSALAKETIFGLVTLPLALFAGFTLKDLFAGMTLIEVLNQSISLMALLVGIVILIVAGYSSHLMNKAAFGSYIEMLEDQIKQFESLARS